MFFIEMPAWDVTLRLVSAAVLGMVVGLERELRRKPAGMRTHMLVATGASAFIIIGVELVTVTLEDDNIRADPTRIIEGVIGGIGFLGAGAIIKGNGDVTGLTTGASVWVAGAIGIACGVGYFDIAALLAVIVLVIVYVLGRVEAAAMRAMDRAAGRDTPKERHDGSE
ncbi:MAG: MgtC/SapB family protein [Rhodospirillaceae bacterium]